MKFFSILSIVCSTTFLSVISTSAFAGECPRESMGSCMVQGDVETCLDLSPSAIPLSAFRANCEAMGSTFQAGACPKEGIAKRCEVPFMEFKGIVLSIYGTEEDATEFTAICKNFAGKVCQ